MHSEGIKFYSPNDLSSGYNLEKAVEVFIEFNENREMKRNGIKLLQRNF